MKVKSFQKKSSLKRECEDAFFCNDDVKVYGVCDGATPLVTFQDEKGHNGAYVASHLFEKHFTSLKKINELQTEIAKVNQALREKMIAYKIDVSKKEQLWCTCIAVVWIANDTIRYAQLGDCMIVATLHDGTMQVLTKDTVEGISKRAKQKREEDRRKGLCVPGEQLRYNRYLANMPNGYSVANGMPEAIPLIQQGTVRLAEVTSLFICSDGLFHPYWSLKETVRYISNHGIEAYITIIEELEAEKKIRPDDKTAIMIDL